MPLEELTSAAKEATGYLSRSSPAVVAGVKCTVICSSANYSKDVADAGFFSNTATVFHVLKAELAGFTRESLHGKTIIFEGLTLRISSIADNGLRFAMTCESEHKGR